MEVKIVYGPPYIAKKNICIAALDNILWVQKPRKLST